MATNPTTRPERVIQASEAKTHFLRLLDDVERGETVTITRRGKVVARLSPEPAAEPYEVRARQAFKAILEIRKRTKPTSIEEILAFRDEGRM